MTAHDARTFLESWDPDAAELPDWVADALDDDPDLQALFDARFTPWEAGDLARPAELGPARARPRWGLWAGMGTLLAASLAGVIGVGGLASVAMMAGREPPMVSPIAQNTPGDRLIDTGFALPPGNPPPVRVTSAPRPDASLLRSSRPTGASTPSNLRVPAASNSETAGLRWTNQVDLPPADAHVNGLMDGDGDHRVEIQAAQIEIRERVQFRQDQALPAPGAEPLLDAIAQVLADNPEVGTIVLEGHTRASDDAGRDTERSTQRAEAVRDALVRRGVDPSRLQTAAFGSTRPLVPENSGDADRNGRVELRIVQETPAAPAPAVPEPTGTEDYTDYGHHHFVRTAEDAQSTFGADVDTASYTLSRRKLREGYLPPQAAVRVEEFVNYLPYDYAPPADPGSPFAVHVEASPNPFNPRTHWVRIGVQGRKVAVDQRRSVHLTFLVDTSGSMQSDDKLGLVKTALKALTEELRDGDTVALVAYAGSAGVILEPTPMSRRDEVLGALDRLRAGGSTAMGQGITLAYQLADQTYADGAVNRVVILSDGDANVGTTSPDALLEEIRQYADRGITLTTAGFGQGNYQDTRMERLANEGDGNYWYIDSEQEAQRVFVDRLTSTLVLIARDVKLQVQFDPDAVEAYRLVGYENRDIADRDFRNDKVDAGEIGAGHQVTALYEVALAPGASGDIATLRLRNKAPGPDAPASERSFPVSLDRLAPQFEESSPDLRMAVAAASFAELLRGNPHLHGSTYADVADIVRQAVRVEYDEDRELLDLIETAGRLSR